MWWGMGERKVRINVWVSEELKEVLEERAKESGRSMSGFVTWTLDRVWVKGGKRPSV